MRAIASITGGKSYTAKSAERLEAVYQQLGSSIGRRRETRDIGSWFAAGAAALLAAAIGAGRILAAPLP